MKPLFLDIKEKDSQSKIIIYYFENHYFDNKDDMHAEINQNIESLKEKLDGLSYVYFLYFRHNYFIL
jgi:predicted translin family RNA/ssDNA-binding protein